MTPQIILTAVRLGQDALRDQHAVIKGLWKQFGASVKRTRLARRISRKALARHLRCTTAMIGLMENGQRPWKMERAEKAVRLLNRPEQWPDAGRSLSR
jgi:ribosome-binding protein aMBF1 (putative translation factor)